MESIYINNRIYIKVRIDVPTNKKKQLNNINAELKAKLEDQRRLDNNNVNEYYRVFFSTG
jgi:hypothetical protein